jgi:hypothetical protein
MKINIENTLYIIMCLGEGVINQSKIIKDF